MKTKTLSAHTYGVKQMNYAEIRQTNGGSRLSEWASFGWQCIKAAPEFALAISLGFIVGFYGPQEDARTTF